MTLPLVADYQLHLPSFEGPLDVLLQLIERNRMEISDVSLVSITAGFIDHINAMVDPEPALLASFVAVASRLLVLKSRALLPRRTVEDLEDEPDDLAAQLREYQRIKTAAALLREREHAGLRSHARPPGAQPEPAVIVLSLPPVSHLRRSLLRAAARMRVEPELRQLRLQISIEQMIGRIRHEVARYRLVGFRAIVAAAPREELVAGFVALLAMWRRGEVRVEQSEHFAEIWIQQRAVDGPVA